MRHVVVLACSPRPALARPRSIQKGAVRVSLRRQDRARRRLPRSGIGAGRGLGRDQDRRRPRASPQPQLTQIEIAINRHGRLDSDRPAGLRDRRHPARDHRERAGGLPRLAGRRRPLRRRGRRSPSQAAFPSEGKLFAFNGTYKGKPGDPRPRLRRPAGADLLHPALRDRHGQGHLRHHPDRDAAPPPTATSSPRSTSSLQRTYTYKGKKRSYASAGCPAPKGFPGATLPLRQGELRVRGGQEAELDADAGLSGAGVGLGRRTTLTSWEEGPSAGSRWQFAAAARPRRRRQRAGRHHQGADPGRQHHRHRRRRVHAERAAEEQRRADHDLRQGTADHGRRHPAAGPENDRVRIRQTRLGPDRRPAEMHRRQIAGDDGAGRAQALPGGDRRQGVRPRRRQVPRTGRRSRSPRRSRSSTARRSRATPASSPTSTRRSRPRSPSSSRSGSKRSTTAATAIASTPRSRKSPAAPASPSPARSGSAANGPTKASSTATSTPAAPTAACRRSASSASSTGPC